MRGREGITAGWRLRARMLPLSLGFTAAFGAIACLLFAGLGDSGLRGDEGFYGLVAAAMVDSGDPLHLTLEGRPFLNKPPFAFWAMALSAKLLGLSELSLRLPSAIASLTLAAVVCRIGARRDSAWTGLLAAILFVSAPHALYYHGWRAAVTDSWMVLWTLTTLTTCAARRPGWKARAVVLSVVNALTKGLVGPALAFVSMVLVELTQRPHQADGASVPTRRARAALELAALILVPSGLTYVAWWTWNAGRLDAIGDFLYRDWLLRAVGKLQASHVQPWHHLLDRALADFGWWWLLFAVALGSLRFRNGSKTVDRESLALLFLPVVTLLLFSISRSKIAWYVYPAYPAAALVIAESASRTIRRVTPRSWTRTSFALLIAAAAATRATHAYQRLPRGNPASLASLALFVDQHDEAAVYFDVRLRSEAFRPREWNRFAIYERLAARPWPPPAAQLTACSFLITPDPAALDLPHDPESVIRVPPQARSSAEPPLHIVDLCGRAFARSLAGSTSGSATAIDESD